MLVKQITIWSVLLCLVVCPPPTAKASEIQIALGNSGWAMIVNPEVNAGIGSVSFPFVYGIKGDSVFIELDKTFTRPFDYSNQLDPIVVEFEKKTENAVKNIVIRDEYIINNTGSEWHDYHMQLIVDLQNPIASFNPQILPSGGQFEEVAYSLYQGWSGNPIRLDFFNEDGTTGVMPSPSGVDVFRPGYIHGDIFINIDPTVEVGARFGLKQFPTIPEPTSIALFAFGILPAMLKRKKG